MRSSCTLVVLLAFSTAHADAPDDAKKLADEGTKQFNVQQYAKAAELYQQAYLLDPKPGYLYATGQAQRLGGMCDKALLTYDAYLRTNPGDAERAKTETNIERCKQDLKQRDAAVQATQLAPPPEVPPPPAAPVPVEPAPAPVPAAKSYVIGHLLVGAGAVALGGGVYLFQVGRSAISEHNGAPTYQAFLDSRDAMDAAEQKQALGVVAMTAGAALVAGGVVYYALHARGGEAPVTASVSGHQAIVWFRRSF